MAGRVGFEPTEAFTSLDFKSSALNRSAIYPFIYLLLTTLFDLWFFNGLRDCKSLTNRYVAALKSGSFCSCCCLSHIVILVYFLAKAMYNVS